jgi:hypothetical protein
MKIILKKRFSFRRYINMGWDLGGQDLSFTRHPCMHKKARRFSDLFMCEGSVHADEEALLLCPLVRSYL